MLKRIKKYYVQLTLRPVTELDRRERHQETEQTLATSLVGRTGCDRNDPGTCARTQASLFRSGPKRTSTITDTNNFYAITGGSVIFTIF